MLSNEHEHGELQRQVLDGSWTLQGHDDILSRALGRKEHGGCVRGVGGGAKIKEVFRSGTSKQSGVVSMDELATITQEITKKVQKECDEKMNEMMNLKLQGIFDQLKQMGVSLPDDNFVKDVGTPGTVRSSCQSVDRQDHFSNLTLIGKWVLVQEAIRKRKSMRCESFGQIFFLLNVYNQVQLVRIQLIQSDRVPEYIYNLYDAAEAN